MDFHSTLEDTQMIAQARIQSMISQDPIDPQQLLSISIKYITV